MGLLNWFTGLFNKDGTLALDINCGELAGEIFYKELAIQACINLISNTVARSEFLTFDKGIETRKDNYYLLNVEPNQNKNGSKFWKEVICKLLRKNECLVVQINKMFYMAESFEVIENALTENTYKNVVIGTYELKDVFTESQILHFELHNQSILPTIEGVAATHSKLAQSASTSYRRNKAKRGTLEVPTNYPQTDAAQAELEKLLSERFKRFVETENAALLPLTGGMKYQAEIANGTSNENTMIKSFINDIFEFVAIGYQIPPQLLNGNVADTDKVVNNYMTFCINPLAEILTDEINRKYYGKAKYLERTYAKLDTSRIKVLDIKDIASSMDILTRIGANCVDDNLKLLGLEPLNTEWSKARWMTKNYERIETRSATNTTVKGGE